MINNARPGPGVQVQERAPVKMLPVYSSTK